MSTTLPTGIVLPEEGGDSQVWDNKLSGSLTLIDTMLRQFIAMDNDQNPVGTIKQIPTSAALPLGWEEITDSEGRTLVSATSTISDGDTGGDAEWDGTPETTVNGEHTHASAGDHQHPAAGGHTHDSAGNHNHGNYQGQSGFVSLTKAQLPAVPLAVSGAGTYLTRRVVGSPVQSLGGDGFNLYDGTIGNTENMGSGQGHNHSIIHNHAFDGGHTHNAIPDHQHNAAGDHEHDASGDHKHDQSVHKWLSGGRWIRRARDLTFADLQGLAPV